MDNIPPVSTKPITKGIVVFEKKPWVIGKIQLFQRNNRNLLWGVVYIGLLNYFVITMVISRELVDRTN